MRFRLLQLFCCAALTCISSTHATDRAGDASGETKILADIPVPALAIDLRRRYLSEDKFYQVDYKMMLPRDDTSVMKFYLERYRPSDGWEVCSKKNDLNWNNDLHLSKSGTDTDHSHGILAVRRYSELIYSKLKQRMVMVELSYVGDDISSKQIGRVSEETLQKVRVNVYMLNGENIVDILKQMGCVN